MSTRGERICLFFEATIWVAFLVVGSLLWLHQLYSSGRLVLLGFVGAAWLASIAASVWTFWKWKTKVPAVLIFIVWCVVLLVVHW